MKIEFRPLTQSDFPLLQRWLSEPHVEAWWHWPADLAGVTAKYGPRIDGKEPTRVLIIECEDLPVGWVQWHRWSDYTDHAMQLGAERSAAGLDLAIGEGSMLGKGIGSLVLRKVVEEVIFADSSINAVISDPEALNLRSLRAFEKAGFVAGHAVRLFGERVDRRVMRINRKGVA